MYGFEIADERVIPEINSHVRLLIHVKTGAELLSVENGEENKCFVATFRTPPPNTAGLPHVMEHVILNSGTRQYPVKSPITELRKGSLQTFMNAFTWPDKTMYPVASQNLTDFYNLVNAYLDIVFYPQLKPEALWQEGWRYELNSDHTLTYNGVVFNEVKGILSSPESVLERRIFAALFPDCSYGFGHGGDPATIPTITYAQLRDFYENHYHPSNARFFFYGNDDPDMRLQLVDNYLKDFDRKIAVEVKLQPRFDAPRRTVYPYQSTGQQAYVRVTWLLPEFDIDLDLAFTILGHILLGNAAAPLRKALLESKLGEEITRGGFLDYGVRQMVFTTGLKGVSLANQDTVEPLILDTLARIAADGIDPIMIKASLNTIEFDRREFNTGRLPRGWMMLLTACRGWLYGVNPVDVIAFDALFATLKEQIVAHPRFFETMIEDHLLANPHRSTVFLEPDAQLDQRLKSEEKARLEAISAGLSEHEWEEIVANNQQLKQWQATPDSPEAIATIPALTLADLDKQVKTTQQEVLEIAGVPVYYHDLPTNHILYLDVGFNLQALPSECLPYVLLFGKMLIQAGTDREDFEALSRRIGCEIGGIRPETMISQHVQPKEAVTWYFLRCKATAAQTDELLAMLGDILLRTVFDQPARFLQVCLEEKNRLEAELIPAGHLVTRRRLLAHFHQAGWAEEQITGMEYLLFLRQLITKIETDWSSIVRMLHTMRDHLIQRQAMLLNVTINAAHRDAICTNLEVFLGQIPDDPVKWAVWTPQYQAENEGLALPARVNYVGMGGSLYASGYKLHGSLLVIYPYLMSTWLTEQIRIKGGAYAAITAFDVPSGIFSYTSYRDPNLTGTLATYQASGDFLRRLTLTDAELTKAIISAIGLMDIYQLPDTRGYESLKRSLIGLSDEYRQHLRDEVLATTRQDFSALGEILSNLNDAVQVVVMGSPEVLAEAGLSRILPVG